MQFEIFKSNKTVKPFNVIAGESTLISNVFLIILFFTFTIHVCHFLLYLVWFISYLFFLVLYFYCSQCSIYIVSHKSVKSCRWVQDNCVYVSIVPMHRDTNIYGFYYVFHLILLEIYYVRFSFSLLILCYSIRFFLSLSYY